MIDKNTMYVRFAFFCIFMIIIVYPIWENWTDNCIIKILPDEFGYWAAGGWIANLRWEPLKETMPYYGIGYAAILGFLLKLPFETIFLYHLAVIINGVMLVVMYLLNGHILRQYMLFDEFSSNSMAIFVTILSANLYYAQYTMVEMPLSFLYTILCFLIWKFIEEKRNMYGIISIIISLLMLSFHMRTVFIPFFVLLFCFLQSKEKKDKILALLVFLLGLFLFYILKKSFQEGYVCIKSGYLEAPSGSKVDVNDVTGNFQKVLLLLTYNGFLTFVKCFCGRFYYTLMASFGVISVSICLVIGLLNDISRSWRDKSKLSTIKTEEKMLLFCFGSYFGTLMVSCLFNITVDLTDRMDLLTYSRYFEFSIAAVVFWGIVVFRKRNCNLKASNLAIYGIILILVFGKITNLIQTYDNTDKTRTFVQCYLSRFYEMLFSRFHDFLLPTIICTIVVFCIFLILVSCKNKNLISIWFLAITIFFVYATLIVYDKWTWKSSFSKEMIEEKQFIEDTFSDYSLYSMYNTDLSYIYALQFLEKDKTINLVYSFEDIDNIENDNKSLLLISNNEPENRYLSHGYKKIYNGRVNVWIKSVY